MMDKLDALRDWLVRTAGTEWFWFAKRLSANDTGLTGAHQVGFYVPRDFALAVAPELARPIPNPRRVVRFKLMSHDQESKPNLIYYNSRVLTARRNGRNEFRVTGFGGRRSALQDQNSTGAILVTAWNTTTPSNVEAWLAETVEEEEAIESALGPVEPGTQVLRLPGLTGKLELTVAAQIGCEPDISELPAPWSRRFPVGEELTEEAVRRRPGTGQTPDFRLVERYACEYGLFRVVEAHDVLPSITGGFRTVDGFLSVAQRVANRRKSRAGRSLELHLAKIFDEEGVTYDARPATEANRRPDFVFPSIAAYRLGRQARMLGAKTSVRERWRQVLDEAARIPDKHLFTLSEGVSPGQFAQMEESRITLVVPEGNLPKFPLEIRPKLMTLASFVGLVR